MKLSGQILLVPREVRRLWRGDRFFELASLAFRACFCVIQSNISAAQIYIYIYIYFFPFGGCNILNVVARRMTYRGADKSLARPTSRCILFDGSLVIFINSTNIPPIMIINRIYEHQNLLSL